MAQIAVGGDGASRWSTIEPRAMFGLSDRDLGRPFQDLEVSYRPIELAISILRR